MRLEHITARTRALKPRRSGRCGLLRTGKRTPKGPATQQNGRTGKKHRARCASTRCSTARSTRRRHERNTWHDALGSRDPKVPQTNATLHRSEGFAEADQPTPKGVRSIAPRMMQLQKLGKPDYKALLSSRIRTLAPWVRRRSGRCSLGLPPPQGFLPRGRENALTVSTLSGFTTPLIRRSWTPPPLRA